MATGTTNRQTVFSWLNTFLRDLGLQFSRSGFKGGNNIGNHVVDVASGFWANPQYSGNKPPRWLFHIDVTGTKTVARLPDGLQEIGIGSSNTAQGDKAGLATRILPLIQTGADAFRRADSFEANVLFVFHGALDAGSSSDAFRFNPTTGGLFRSVDHTPRQEEYIFAALLGLLPRTETFEIEENGVPTPVSYGDTIDAIQAAIHIHPTNGTLGPIPLYDLSDDDQVATLKAEITAAWDAAGPVPTKVDAADAEEATEEIDFAHIEIPVKSELLGIDPAVYRQINAMLHSGKQHIMLYGPPGTGKTSLARWIASSLPGGQWTLVTGSSDWTSQDIIGGYQPIGDGNVDFVPGILLRAFDQPLIIDELNRCDIDKVIGPLFTVLSGQQTTLPYRTDISDKNSQPYVILPKPKANAAAHEFAPGPAWRLIATINSIDKASLYQMSYALSRRFGWVYVDAPTDLASFIGEYLTTVAGETVAPAADATCPLAKVWQEINATRVIGPAPIIDAIKAIRDLAPGAAFFGPADPAMRSAALDAFDMVLLPMLDGIVLQDARNIAHAMIEAYALTEQDAARVKRRLESVAI